MNGLPYYKAYPRDFIDGTVGMSFELKGTYRLVLDLIYMQGGALPDDARYISGLLGCSVRFWNKARQQLIEVGKIRSENGIISNFRADKELKSLRTLQEKNRENGSKSNKNKDLGKANAQLTRGKDTDTDTEKKETKVSKKVERPADVEPGLWSDFLAHRRSQRATLTVTALKGFEREASKANLSLPQAIQIAIERGWRGFKADWIKPEDRPKPQLVHSRETVVIEVHSDPDLFDEAVRWASKYLPTAVRDGQEHIKIPAHVAANLRDSMKETA